MDFNKNHESSNPTSDHQHKPSHSELLKSAKLVADAAQSHLRHEPTNYDKAKVASAAADLLDAAGDYGKLDDKGMGKYLDQAEGYLRKYGNTSQQQHAGLVGAGAHAGKTSGTSPEKKKSEHGEGGGASDYIKMAQGFLHKDGGGGGGGGKGDFMKMAGDFLKK